jgi:cellulose synthase/poly-beta-1,6-N-acetylglucosamine synthase-like glycosyltransferase
MLIDALTITLYSLGLATLTLLLSGRAQRQPSRALSLLLILCIEGSGAAIAFHFGVPRAVILVWAIVSSLLALLLILRLPGWNAAGHATLLFLAEASLLYLLAAGTVALLGAGNLVSLAFGIILWLLQAVSITLCISFTFEMLDVVCRRRWRYTEAQPPRIAAMTIAAKKLAHQVSPAYVAASRGSGFLTHTSHFNRNSDVDAQQLPRVALHVPCHNEPPDVVIQTLETLAQLDYPRTLYDVIVVDNNTSEPELWNPLVEACEHLGFRLLHLEDWPGYKSGALNYALALTPDDVDIIGVVDADYLVQPEYLRELVTYFDDPKLAFVQTPQDYRDYRAESTFYQRACYHAYRYFFDLSMPSRNERNAIIFGGTMGLIRASALRQAGGWDEWCITEDAEASLRLLARGWKGRFINHSYGKGLMPLEFDALKRQRFRWCFGGIQILRKHWHMLVPWAVRGHPADGWESPGLTLAQRYHYLMGGLQWFSDVLSFLFTSLLLITGWLLVAGHPVALPVIGGPLLVLPLTFWITSLLRTLWALRVTRRCSWGEAIGAIGILWSLGWVVTLACIQGLIQPKGVFLRTPKSGRASLVRALRSTTIETVLGGLCWALAAVLLGESITRALAHVSVGSHGSSSANPAAVLSAVIAHVGPWWAISGSALPLGILAILQGITYLSAPALCLLSLRTEVSARGARQRALGDTSGEGTLERGFLLAALAGVSALAAFLFLANALPSSPIGQQRQQTVTRLLGNGNPVNTPIATPAATGANQTPSPGNGGASATPTISGAATATSAIPVATATSTPRPGATPTTRATPQATPPVTHATPTPRPHP